MQQKIPDGMLDDRFSLIIQRVPVRGKARRRIIQWLLEGKELIIFDSRHDFLYRE